MVSEPLKLTWPDTVNTGPLMTGRLEHESFVDATAVGNFLQLRRRHVLELARQGLIPAYPLGTGSRRVWRFRISEVVTALGSSRVDYSRQSPAPEQETV